VCASEKKIVEYDDTGPTRSGSVGWVSGGSLVDWIFSSVDWSFSLVDWRFLSVDYVRECAGRG